MYVFQEIHDSHLMLFLFFSFFFFSFSLSTSLAASPSYNYLPVNFTISTHSFPIPQSFQLSTFNAAFDFAIELKPIDSTRLRQHTYGESVRDHRY